MTTYAGEQLRVVSTVADFDGGPLGSTDVMNVTVTIQKADGTEVVTDEAMTFDVDAANWVFIWNTDGYTPGTYKAKVLVTGLDGAPSWELKRIRLARSAF